MSEDNKELKYNWETMTKRLLGAMYYGFSIVNTASEKVILVHLACENFPEKLLKQFRPDWSDIELIDPSSCTNAISWIKHQGPVNKALDHIDELLTDAGYSNTLDVCNRYNTNFTIFG
jgi:hypothetical protein